MDVLVTCAIRQYGHVLTYPTTSTLHHCLAYPTPQVFQPGTHTMQ